MSQQDDPSRLSAIRARLEQASKGPWTNGVRGSGSSGDAHMCRIVARGHDVADNPNIAGAQIGVTWHPDYVVSYVGLSRQECIDNAEFMAHARDDIPYLLAQIDTLSSRIKQLEALEQLHVDILHNRADDLTKAACDECEQCGEAVMCSYHSVLSELARQVEMPQQ